MKLHRTPIPLIFTLSLPLAACAGFSGDWPSLADPYPSASERERVIERAQPAAPVLFTDQSPLNKSAAIKLLTSVRARLDNAVTKYQGVVASLKDAHTGDDRDLQIDLWNEAQLSLTRLSHTASQLDAILETERLSPAPVWENARKLKQQQDMYLVAERRTLGDLRPLG